MIRLTDVQLRYLECLSDRVLFRDSWVPNGIDVYSQFEYKEFKMAVDDKGVVRLTVKVGKIGAEFLHTIREFEIGTRGKITLLNGKNEMSKGKVRKKVYGFNAALTSRVV